jgi:hypothetical protein
MAICDCLPFSKPISIRTQGQIAYRQYYLIRKISYRLVGNVSNKVGDLLPKGRVGDSRLESVFGWQLKNQLNHCNLGENRE